MQEISSVHVSHPFRTHYSLIIKGVTNVGIHKQQVMISFGISNQSYKFTSTYVFVSESICDCCNRFYVSKISKVEQGRLSQGFFPSKSFIHRKRYRMGAMLIGFNPFKLQHFKQQTLRHCCLLDKLRSPCKLFNPNPITLVFGNFCM